MSITITYSKNSYECCNMKVCKHNNFEQISEVCIRIFYPSCDEPQLAWSDAWSVTFMKDGRKEGNDGSEMTQSLVSWNKIYLMKLLNTNESKSQLKLYIIQLQQV